MAWEQATQWLLGGTAVVWIVYDVIAYVKGGNPATISVQTQRLAKQYPIIPLILGIVLGHIFWPITQP